MYDRWNSKAKATESIKSYAAHKRMTGQRSMKSFTIRNRIRKCIRAIGWYCVYLPSFSSSNFLVGLLFFFFKFILKLTEYREYDCSCSCCYVIICCFFFLGSYSYFRLIVFNSNILTTALSSAQNLHAYGLNLFFVDSFRKKEHSLAFFLYCLFIQSIAEIVCCCCCFSFLIMAQLIAAVLSSVSN